MNSPLESVALFHIGPIPITQALITTWAIMLVLVIGSALLTRRLTTVPSKRQAALELIVTTIDTQIRETTGAEPAPYRAFIGTLFLFTNWLHTYADALSRAAGHFRTYSFNPNGTHRNARDSLVRHVI